MFGSDIIGLTRLKLDDSVPDSAGNYLWSALELLFALQAALDELTTSGLLIKDRSTASICSISIVRGTAEYNLSPRIIMINDPIVLTTLARPIYPVTESHLYDFYGDSWATQTGNPTHYVADLERRKIRFFPIPIANDTVTMDVYRTSVVRFTEANITTVTPEVAEEWHYGLISGMLSNAYDKNDVETREMPGFQIASTKWANTIEQAKRLVIKNRYREQRSSIPRGLIC